METTPVQHLINDILQHVNDTMKVVEKQNAEIMNLQEEHQKVVTYDTRLYYTEGFWDGFMFGAVMMTSIMSGMIYLLR